MSCEVREQWKSENLVNVITLFLLSLVGGGIWKCYWNGFQHYLILAFMLIVTISSTLTLNIWKVILRNSQLELAMWYLTLTKCQLPWHSCLKFPKLEPKIVKLSGGVVQHNYLIHISQLRCWFGFCFSFNKFTRPTDYYSKQDWIWSTNSPS